MASNSSSISLVDSIQSHTSNDNINIVYNIPSTNPYLYKPVRPTKSRLRPALPNVFLQLPGSDGRSSPWKQRSEPKRQASFESTTSTMASTSNDNTISKEDQLLIPEITDGMQYMRGSSPVGSNVSQLSTPAMTAAADSGAASTIGHSRGFSTCFAVGSTSSLLDPGMMRLDTPKMETTRPSTRSRGFTSDYGSSSGSEYLLTDWSTPRIAKTPTLRISCKDLPSLPSCSKGNNQIPSASRCPIYRDESYINWNTDDDSDVLHIRLPASTTSSSLVVVGKKRSLSTRMQEQEPFNPEQSSIKYNVNPSRGSIKRKNQELKAGKQASKIARIKERNMRIKLEDPKVKNASTEIDSIFGIGKEESKAMRCGYSGLGIAYDKRTWKATDDFQSLLRDTVRSSLYNLSPRSPRSPRSTIRRKFSNAGNTYTPGHSPSQSRSISSPSLSSTTAEDSPAIERRKRRGPPPPLDLSSLSSFSTLGEIKTARKTFVGGGKSDRRKESSFTTKRTTEREIDKMEKLTDDGELREMKTPRKITLKKILRSVRSISNMRGGH